MSEQDERPEDHIMFTKKNDAPANPFGQITEGAIQLHEMYISYREGGFTRSEALELIARIITCYGERTDPPAE